MHDIKIQITDHLHFCKIRFLGSTNLNLNYALYVYDKGEITKINYSNSSEFVYFYKHSSSVISLKLFINNADSSDIFTQSFHKIFSYRKCNSLDNISFKESFDIDYLSKWRTPVKYIKKESNTNKKLIVFLNGALSNKLRYPVYNRVSWQDKFNADCLYVYDSSLSQNNNYLLAWYVGNYNNILYKDIIKLVDKAKNDLSLQAKQVVFYGSSGGGFAALKLAEYFIGSTAVAINPQIEILKYSNDNAIDNFMKFTFDKIPPSIISEKYKNWITINPKSFKKGSSKFIYVQNIVDGDHYRNHLRPFWNNFNEILETGFDKYQHNQLIIYDHPSGHAGEPPDILEKIISELNL